MPIQFWVFLIPAAVLLLCGLYTRRKRRRWPSFSVGLILCDGFFLACTMVVSIQLRLLLQANEKPMASGSYRLPIKRFADALIRGRMSASACAEAYGWLRVITIIFVLCTIISMVWECYRIFSVPPELAAAQKKLSEREERLHRWIPVGKEKEREPHERKNKL